MKECNCSQHIYRAIRPWYYQKKNGTISHAAFIDDKGLSVEIQDERTNEEVCAHMWGYLEGRIASIGEQVCLKNEMLLSKDDSLNTYHRLVLDKNYMKKTTMALTDSQAIILAKSICNIFEESKSGT